MAYIPGTEVFWYLSTAILLSSFNFMSVFSNPKSLMLGILLKYLKKWYTSIKIIKLCLLIKIIKKWYKLIKKIKKWFTFKKIIKNFIYF